VQKLCENILTNPSNCSIKSHISISKLSLCGPNLTNRVLYKEKIKLSYSSPKNKSHKFIDCTKIEKKKNTYKFGFFNRFFKVVWKYFQNLKNLFAVLIDSICKSVNVFFQNLGYFEKALLTCGSESETYNTKFHESCHFDGKVS
jgi:hypothetical protein